MAYINMIDDFTFKKKKVLLRIDVNSPVEKGKVQLSDRLEAHAETIKELKKKNAAVVILAHQGRPGDEEFLDLKQHAKLLNKFVKVDYVDDVFGNTAVNAIKKLKVGDALLLGNVRALKEEYHPGRNNKMVKTLAPLFNIYINDAFSVAHRNQTSIVSFPKVLEGCVGRVMEKELMGFINIHVGKKPSTYILAGFKPDDNILLMEYALKNKKTTTILTAGLFGQLCLLAKGINLGKQTNFLEQQGQLYLIPRLKKLMNKYEKQIETPIDLAVNKKGRRIDIDVIDFPSAYEIFDLGPKTVIKYLGILKKSKTIFMKGPTGYYHDKKFATSTKEILKVIENCKAYTLVGGGHTLDAMRQFKIKWSKFSHVSLSGGALVAYLAGRKLPGLEALKNV